MVAYWALLAAFKPGVVVDERTHLHVIGQLARGEEPTPGLLPMLPAMHWTYTGAMRVTGVSLLGGRTLSAAMSIAAILCIYAAARRLYPRAAGAAALLFALNPMYFPYTALVYTEPPAMLALALAVMFHVRRRIIPATIALTVACAFRQSNIVWCVFLVVWAAAESALGESDRATRGQGDKEESGGAPPASDGPTATGLKAQPAWTPGSLSSWGPFLMSVPRSLGPMVPVYWPYLLPVVAFAVAAVFAPEWVLSPTEDNRAGFNIAQFFLFGIVCAAAFAPRWLVLLIREWPIRLGPAMARATVCALLVAAVGFLESAYDNPHHWNASTNYVHDQAVVLLHTSMLARYMASLVLVVAGIMIARYTWQAFRREPLIVAWLFSLLFLAPHRLVDHRYYIIPIMMINLAARYDRRERGVLCVWFAVLAAVTAGYTLLYGGIESGL